MMTIFDLKDKLEYANEVMELELLEWGDNPNYEKEEKIAKKTKKYLNNLDNRYFCKLILLNDSELIGFISIFPHDCDECPDLTPWYATMYVKKEYRGKGYSRLLNDAILDEAKKRDIHELYLKTTLNNYYEKFGAKFVKKINGGEKLLKFDLI